MLSPDRVAEFVLYLITLPRDAFLLNPMLYPLHVRTKRANAAQIDRTETNNNKTAVDEAKLT